MEIHDFLEKDYQRIKSLLEDGALFRGVQNEEIAIQNMVDHLASASQRLMEQQRNLIDQKFRVKMNSINVLLSKLKEASNNIGVLNREDIIRLETALGEMLHVLELQKEHECAENEKQAAAKKEANIADYKNCMGPALEKHFEEAQEKLRLTTDQLNLLEDYYETASFRSEIWKNLAIQSKFPKLKNIRLGEQLVPINSVGNTESFAYEVPEIVPFYAQKSLTVIYKSNERAMLKNVMDNIFIRSLMSAKAGNVLFYFLDPVGKGELFLDYLNFSQTSTKQILNNKIFTNAQEIDEAIKKLVSIYDDVEQNYLKGKGVEEYNAKSKVTIPYRIVVIDAFPLGLSVNVTDMIKKLSRYEIGAGLHFVFLVEETQLGKVEEITKETTVIQVGKHLAFTPQQIQNIKKSVLEYTDLNFNTAVDASFEECFVDKEWWQGDCSNFTTVPLGLAKAVNYDLEFDEEGKKSIPSAHMVIAGQTGCGKSFLLHSLIMALSIKYSPNDLKFFLIDLKGAEFKQYDTYKLPHAEFVAINGNPEFGLHVLRVVRSKMNERNDEFKAKGVERLPEYRKMYPNAIMPRYFIIIDEYQRMLSSGGPSREARFLIEDIAKVGRALGFNLVLSSQSVMLDADTLGNFTHRIAMRCSQFIAHQVLGYTDERCPDLKVGQAIVHQGSGYDKIQSYFLPKQADVGEEGIKTRVDYLKEIAQKWEAKTRGQYEHNLIVFDGESTALLENNKTVMRMQPDNRLMNVVFSPGEKILVDGHDLIGQLERGTKNQNLLVLGGKLNVSLRAMNGCLMSMLGQFDPNAVRIDIANFVNRSNSELYESIKESSQYIAKTYAGSNYFEMDSDMNEWLDELVAETNQRLSDLNSTNYYAPRIVVFYQPENKEEYHQTLVSSRPEKWKMSEFLEKFQIILEKGSTVGIHCLFHFLDPDSFFSEFDEDHLTYFGHRVLLQMKEEDSKTMLGNNRKDAARLFDPNMKEEHANNRAIYYNVYSAHYEIIKPYDFYKKL